MSNYTKSTNFAVKDGLSAGTAAKRVRGTEIDDEYNAISVAIATKANTNNTALTGVPTSPTAATATNTTQLATTAYVQANVSTKANTNNAALTGVPTAPTASTGTNTTQLATTAFVNTAAAIMPAGSVLQVKNFNYSGIHDSGSNTNIGTPLVGTITPSSSSNKILVTCHVNCETVPAFGSCPVYISCYRGAGLNANLSGTNLAPAVSGVADSYRGFCAFHVGNNNSADGMVSLSHLDSPSSTSSVTYTVAMRNANSSGTARIGGRGAQSTMTLMEIKG